MRPRTVDLAVAASLALSGACGSAGDEDGPLASGEGTGAPVTPDGAAGAPAPLPSQPIAGADAPAQVPVTDTGAPPASPAEPASEGPGDDTAAPPSPTERDDPPASTAGRLPPVDAVDVMGPFEVTIEQAASPGGGWVARPSELGQDGVVHPIFVWGCGGGSQPSQYEDHMRLIASHGFVMESHVSTGDASDHAEPLSWLLAQNEDPDSPYFQRLDGSKIAAGGHSMGSIATFAFEGDTDLLTTSIHVAGGSFDGNGYLRLRTPTLMVGGVDDTLAGANTDRDFERVTVPAFYTNIEDTDHIYAARAGLPPIVAWLRWHLGGDEERSRMFLDDDCDFCGGIWNGQAKNW